MKRNLVVVGALLVVGITVSACENPAVHRYDAALASEAYASAGAKEILRQANEKLARSVIAMDVAAAKFKVVMDKSIAKEKKHPSHAAALPGPLPPLFAPEESAFPVPTNADVQAILDAGTADRTRILEQGLYEARRGDVGEIWPEDCSAYGRLSRHPDCWDED